MNTTTLLVIFSILLILLTLLSAFGGTLRPNEHFYQDHPFLDRFTDGTFVKPPMIPNMNTNHFGEGCSSSNPDCMKSDLEHISSHERFKEKKVTEPFINNLSKSTEPATINPLSGGNTSSIQVDSMALKATESSMMYGAVEPFDAPSNFSAL